MIERIPKIKYANDFFFCFFPSLQQQQQQQKTPLNK